MGRGRPHEYPAPVSEPWVRFEDEHLLVVAKPAGVNTHRPDTYAQDGMYEWVQQQRPGTSLSILHRLDKATSGLLLFGKTPAANQALGRQFEDRRVEKRYELLVARNARRPGRTYSDAPISISGATGRGGRNVRAQGGPVEREASTDFERQAAGAGFERWLAVPHTGRTHQVRVHAQTLSMPIAGDTEHGGTPGPRLFLHAAGLAFDHPVTGPIELVEPRPSSFERALDTTPASFASDLALAARVAHESRALLFDPADTDAYLWIDREHDGFPGIRVERLGRTALVRNYDESGAALPHAWIDAWREASGAEAVFEQRRPRGGATETAHLVSGTSDAQLTVRELGLTYLIDLDASPTSSGLFLDQRETRRRLATADLSGRTVLNAFAHTGSLSVAAASAGAETLTLDLSKRYLDWARDNLRANDLDPADHDFIFGDALEWMDRLVKKGRTFDLVLVDPPSTSTSSTRGAKRWVVERDLHALVERAARLAATGGTVFVSTNLQRMKWPRFVEQVETGLEAAGRRGAIDTQTNPLDHRSGPGDHPYLKAAWIALDGR